MRLDQVYIETLVVPGQQATQLQIYIVESVNGDAALACPWSEVAHLPSELEVSPHYDHSVLVEPLSRTKSRGFDPRIEIGTMTSPFRSWIGNVALCAPLPKTSSARALVSCAPVNFRASKRMRSTRSKAKSQVPRRKGCSVIRVSSNAMSQLLALRLLERG